MKTAISVLSFMVLVSISACKKEDPEKAGMNAPEISISNVTNGTVFFKITVSEDAKEGKLYYGLIRADDPQPTAQDIVEDKVYFTGKKALNGSTTSLFSISQLQSGKTYYLYSIIELNGAVSNLSAKREVQVQ